MLNFNFGGSPLSPVVQSSPVIVYSRLFQNKAYIFKLTSKWLLRMIVVMTLLQYFQ